MAAPVTLKTEFRIDSKISRTFGGGAIQLAHTEDVLFTACDDHVNVLDSRTGQVLRVLAGDTEPVLAFAVSPDDQLFVSCSRSRMIRVWNWRTGECTRQFKSPDVGPVVAVDFDPTSTLVATGSSDGNIRVWDIIKGFATHVFRGSQGVIHALRFHVEKSALKLFSGSDDYRVRVWDLKSSKQEAVMEGHVSAPRAFAFAGPQSSHLLFSAGRDKVINVWDWHRRKLLATLPTYEILEGISYIPSTNPLVAGHEDEHHVLTCGERGQLRLWGYPSKICRQEQTVGKPLNTLAFDSRTQVFMTTTFDRTIVFHQADTLACARKMVGDYDEVLDACFLGASHDKVVVATNSEEIHIVDRATQNTTGLVGHADIVMCVDTTVDGSLIFSGSKDSTSRVWAFHDEEGIYKCVATAHGHAEAVSAVAAGRPTAKQTGQCPFYLSGSADLTIKLWHLPESILSAANTLPLTAHFTRKAHDRDINCIAVAPNNKVFASGSQDKTAKLWSVDTGAQLGVFKGHKRGVWSAAFSPVDQVLATASGDTTIKMWSVKDFACLATFEGHQSSVLRVKFLSRGVQLISAGSDGLIKLWNIKTNETVATIDAHDAKVWALDVSGDENCVVSASADATICFWKDATLLVQAEKNAEEEKMIVLQQELSNLLFKKEYTKAAKLALSLSQPFRLLSVLQTIALLPDHKHHVTVIIKSLSAEECGALLGFCQQWNTNSRHSHIAQEVLSVVLQCHQLSVLKVVPGINKTIEALIPYTERHLQRMNRMLRQCCLLDYTYGCMKLADPLHRGSIMAKERSDRTTSLSLGGNSQASNLAQDETHEKNAPVAEEKGAPGADRKKRQAPALLSTASPARKRVKPAPQMLEDESCKEVNTAMAEVAEVTVASTPAPSAKGRQQLQKLPPATEEAVSTLMDEKTPMAANSSAAKTPAKRSKRAASEALVKTPALMRKSRETSPMQQGLDTSTAATEPRKKRRGGETVDKEASPVAQVQAPATAPVARTGRRTSSAPKSAERVLRKKGSLA